MGVNIQWFPGHMAKAIRQFEENISLVDIVFEIVDARVPLSSMNPEVARISKNQPHLYIMTKRDLADENMTKKWLDYFKSINQPAIAIDTKSKFSSNDIVKVIEPILREKLEREQAKGMKKRPIRAITVGVPNVGKSTVLNRLVKRRAAQVGNRPGVTKGQQWLKAGSQLELLDTPGILWPKFETQLQADKLALTGAIKEGIYHNDDVALYAIDFFRKYHKKQLMNRYHLNDVDLELSNPDLLLKITKNLGMKDDFEKASVRVIQDVRNNKITRFTLDDVEEVSLNNEKNN